MSSRMGGWEIFMRFFFKSAFFIRRLSTFAFAFKIRSVEFISLDFLQVRISSMC